MNTITCINTDNISIGDILTLIDIEKKSMNVIVVDKTESTLTYKKTTIWIRFVAWLKHIGRGIKWFLETL